MPTKTFFRLSEEKQQRLIKAAGEEFSRVAFNDASISNIVKAADIPRGSFYQYFEDKSDLYFYYFSLLKAETADRWSKILESNDGDLFKSIREYFTFIIDTVIHGEHAAFFRHLFLSMDYRFTDRIFPHYAFKRLHNEHQQKQHADVKDMYVNVDTLRVSNDRELHILIHSLMSVVFQSLGAYYGHAKNGSPISEDQLKQEFNLRIDWFEYGASQKGKKDSMHV